MTALTKLRLDHTQVARLDPLAGLIGLRELDLRHTPIKRLDPLTGLAGLTVLSLSDTSVENLDPLSGLTALTKLDLSSTQVTRLDSLAAMAQLTELFLSDTLVENRDPLSRLTALRVLRLENTKRLSDLRPVVALSGLTQRSKGTVGGLHFTGSRVCDLDPDGLGKLARITDDVSRTMRTFYYLRGLKAAAALPLNPGPAGDGALPR